MSSDFLCVLYDAETKLEWFRSRISTRNVQSVFPERARYVLLDVSAGNVMVLPSQDGFFTDLESGHRYMVPEVRASTVSTPSSPTAAALAAAEKAAAAAAVMNTPPAVRVTNASATDAASPTQHKGTLKGFNFRDAKDKMLRKKKGHGDGTTASEKAANRRSSGMPFKDRESSETPSGGRRRSSTASKADRFTWAGSAGSASDDELKMPVVSEVSVMVVKDTMAMGPLSPDVTAGEVYRVVRVDAVDGNVEAIVREQPHLIRLDCVQLVPMENATAEQRQLMSEIRQRTKDRQRMGAGGSFRRTSSTAQRSVLNQIRSRMKGGDDGNQPPVPSASSPNLSTSLTTSAGSFTEVVSSSDEPLDEKLDPASVYGKPLALNEAPIPGPVRKCVEFFRRGDHIKYEGIFRVPGSSNAVMRIRNKFLVAGSNDYDIPDDENPTVVASALKTFLFELPEPLVPNELWYGLMEITDNRDFELNDAYDLLDDMPEENVAVLRYVFDFLAEVAEYSADNKMSPANLGMVFGIVLLQPPDQNVSNVGSSMPKEVCTFFVEHVDDIFGLEDESSTATE